METLTLSSIVRTLLKFEVGSGCIIFLCHDWQHPDGILIQMYGTQVIYDAASQKKN